MTGGSFGLVAAAGFLCGAVNSVAGGGSLILFPALIATGMPTLVANVTNSVATWPGYVGGVLGFREDLRHERKRLSSLVLATIAGSTTGCVLLLTTSSVAFDVVVPALVLFATLLLAVQPRMRGWMSRHRSSVSSRWLVPSIFLATIYGGYFGGALGVIIIAALALTMAESLPKLNALKGALSLVDGTVSVVVFGLWGPVDWTGVLIAAPTTLLGGYWGARFARRLNEAYLRAAVIGLGLMVTAYLVARVALSPSSV